MNIAHRPGSPNPRSDAAFPAGHRVRGALLRTDTPPPTMNASAPTQTVLPQSTLYLIVGRGEPNACTS
jgi:hypothetical protein